MGPSLPPWLQVSEWSKMWFTNRFLFLHPWVAGDGLWKAMWPRLLWWQMSKTVSMLEWRHMRPCYGKLHVRTWLYWETVIRVLYIDFMPLYFPCKQKWTLNVVNTQCELWALNVVVRKYHSHSTHTQENDDLQHHKYAWQALAIKKKLLFFNMCMLLHGNYV